MFPKMLKVLVLCGVIGLCACGGEQERVPSTPSSPETPQEPAANPQSSQGYHQPSALQSVVSEITLPTSGIEHGMDLNDDGVVDNQIGRIQGDFVEVLGGLEEGTEVVTSGAQKLNEGDKVKVA